MPLMTISAQMEKEDYFTPENGKTNMFYREQGQGGPVLLMIHGLGSNSGAFKKLETLASQYGTTVVIDLPGYGRSEDQGFEAGMKNYAELIKNFVEDRKYQDVILAGHSMGAQIAMTAALQEESQSWLSGLFLMAPAGIETFSENDHAWFKTYVTPQTMSLVPDTQLKQNFDINFASGKLPEDAMFMYEERLALKEDNEAFMAYLNMVSDNVQAMLNEPVINRLPEIEQPVWIMYGEQDYLIPNKLLHPALTMEDLKASCKFSNPESKFMTIGNAGHFLVWEQPEKLNSLLKEFTELNSSE
ncbi:alpha/beta fold hydrolase [Robertkochia marina]|nr:alpha/beta hydrolase [Robertkochia marina]